MTIVERNLRYALVALICATTITQAQDKPRPSGSSVDSLRPPRHGVRKKADISFPEFIITGTEIITPASAEKMPPVTRSGFTLGREPNLYWGPRWHRGLKQSILRPFPSRQTELTVRVGGGMFTTLGGEALLKRRMAKGDLFARGSVEAANGYRDNTDYTVASFGLGAGSWFPFRQGNLLSRSRIQGAVDFSARRYSLFANDIRRDTLTRRSTDLFSYKVDLLSRQNALFNYTVTAGGRHLFMTDMTSASAMTTTEESSPSENRFFVDMAIDRRYESLHPYARLALEVNPYAPGYGPSSTPVFFRLGAGSSWEVTRELIVTGGATMYVFNGTILPTSVRIYPEASIRYALGREWRSYLAFSPRVTSNTYTTLLQENPYLSGDVELRPDEIPVSVTLGLEFDRRVLSGLRAEISYDIANRLHYFDTTTLVDRWDVAYNGVTRIFRFRLEGFGRVWQNGLVRGSIVIQESRNEALDARLPYLPLYSGSLSYEHRFPFGLSATAIVSLVGQRNTGTAELDPYVLGDLEISYDITAHWSVYLAARNITDTRYVVWDNYQARPLFAGGGISWRL